MKRHTPLGLGLGLILLVGACANRAGSIGPIGGSGDPTGSAVRPSTPAVSPSSSGSTPPSTPSGSTPSGPTATSPTGSAQDFTYEVWFTYGERLLPTRRTETFDPAVGSIALRSLLVGPTEAERAAGLGTAIPPSTTLNGLVIEDGIATVDLSGSYDDASGTTGETLRLAQVVYTITQFPTVTGVLFELDGRPVTVFGGHGILLDEPQTRGGYEDQVAPIVVETPLIGERVDNPVTISGTANVFEATVSIQILDATGAVIANTFTTATCGTGCRGDYSARVAYSVNADQSGAVVVFESSAEDGSMLLPVRIPVTLTA